MKMDWHRAFVVAVLGVALCAVLAIFLNAAVGCVKQTNTQNIKTQQDCIAQHGSWINGNCLQAHG